MATYARFSKFEATYNLPIGDYNTVIELFDPEPRTKRNPETGEREPVFLKGVTDKQGNAVQDTQRTVRFYLLDHKVYFEKILTSGQVHYLMTGLGKKVEAFALLPESKIKAKLAEQEVKVHVSKSEKFGLQIEAI